VGGIPSVMVASSGFSVAAQNHLESEEIGYLVVTLKEAQGLRWILLVEQKFAVDREFREASGELVEALRSGDAGPFADSELPYEEWLAVIACGLELFPSPTVSVLKTMARAHFGEGLRYNAVMLLDEAGQLETADVEGAISIETDPDAMEALVELLGRFSS
jgi:hypothetical protein